MRYKGFELYPFQEQAIRAVEAGRSVLVSAPTGAGKTVIAIAHRLSTIAAMDRLIVMDRGRIVEEGNHDTLLRQGGLYADLWSRQSGGFLAKDTAE